MDVGWSCERHVVASVDPVTQRSRGRIEILKHLEVLCPGPLVLITELKRDHARRLRGREITLELGKRARDSESKLLQVCLVVEDPIDRRGIGHAEELAGTPRLAV